MSKSNENKQQQGSSHKKPSDLAYKMLGRRDRNKRRNIARDARRQEKDREKVAVRALLRAEGAVRRLERRIAEAHDKGKPTGKLNESLLKAKCVVDTWELEVL